MPRQGVLCPAGSAQRQGMAWVTGREASLNLGSAASWLDNFGQAVHPWSPSFLKVTPSTSRREQSRAEWMELPLLFHCCILLYKLSSKWGKNNKPANTNHPRILTSFCPHLGTLPESFSLTRLYKEKVTPPPHHSQRGLFPNPPTQLNRKKRDPPSSHLLNYNFSVLVNEVGGPFVCIKPTQHLQSQNRLSEEKGPQTVLI